MMNLQNYPNKQYEFNQAPPPYDAGKMGESSGITDNVINQSIEYTGHMITSLDNERPLKLWKHMRFLAAAELILAVACIIFGSACLGTGVNAVDTLYQGGICIDATGIWVGVLCAITGSLGVGALNVPMGRRCLLTSYFVMSIISAVCCGVLIIMAGIWVAISHSVYIYSTNSKAINYAQALLALNSILLIIAIIHFVMSIVSSAFICYNWNCCTSTGKPTTVRIIQTNAVPMNVNSGSNRPLV